MNNEEQLKIITKKASKVRFTISNALGGIGKAEIIIFVLALASIAPTLVFLTRVNVIASLATSIAEMLIYLFLCFPTPNGDKLYRLIWIAFLFVFKNKKFHNETIHFVQKNYFSVRDTKMGSVYKIQACDFSLSEQIERTPIIDNFSQMLQNLNVDFEIRKINLSYEYNPQKIHLVKKINESNNSQKKSQLQNQLDLITELEVGGQTKITHFLIVYDNSKSVNGKVKNLLFNNQNIFFEEATEAETKLIVKQLICPQDLKDSIEEFNAVQHKNYIKVKDKYISYLTVNQYPLFVADGWLAHFNYPEVGYSLKCYHLSQQESLQLLDKAIKRAEILESKTASANELVKNYLSNFYELIDYIQQSNTALKMVSLNFVVTGNSKRELDHYRTLLIQELRKYGYTPNELKFCQKQAYDNDSNWIKTLDMFWQEMSPSTIASAWPFVPTPLSDEQGIIIGTNENDEPIILDPKFRDSSRKMTNMALLGCPGSGKTWTTKKILNWLYCTNTKIFIIDPDREYDKMLKFYDGQLINVGSSSNKINPLEIFTDNFGEHLNNLGQWFMNMYDDLDTVDSAMFQDLTIELYKKFNITETTDYMSLTADNYPTFTDLFNLVKTKEIKKQNKTKVHSALWALANGFEKHYFNGKTSIDLTSDFIVFDTNELPKNDKMQNAIYYLMLGFIDKKIRENKQRNKLLPEEEQGWVCLAVDEAHRMIKKDNLLALNFLSTLSKQIRKYNGILLVITQNVNDFVGTEQIKTQSQAIINNCLYMFIHRLRGTDIQDFDDLIAPNGRLNKHQISVLTTDRSGLNLFIMNNDRQIMQTEITVAEKKIF